ncbi:MAG: hypothetical protein AAFU67_10625, partial [Bacteroidota bacterium]
SLSQQLQELYTLLLVRIHEQVIYPTATTVRGPLSQFKSRQMGRIKAQKQAQAGATNCINALTPLLDDLNSQINHLVDELGISL